MLIDIVELIGDSHYILRDWLPFEESPFSQMFRIWGLGTKEPDAALYKQT